MNNNVVTSIKALMDLSGRTALITGAAGGIGQEISASLAELGADLILIDRPGTDFSVLKSEILELWNVNIISIECDLEDEQDRNNLINTVNNLNSAIDILINNAAFVGASGLEGWVTDFKHQSVETWRRAMEVNITAVFELSKELAPLLMERKNGSIVNIASIYGMNGPDYSLYEDTAMGNPAAYAVSKGGLLQLTRWLATTLAPDIRVNAISPGGVFRNQPENFVLRYEKRTPLGRMANNEDFKGIIAFLASDLSKYVTGQNIPVDGGWTVW